MARRKKKRRATAVRRVGHITRAGPVTITRADGTTEVKAAYKAQDFRAIVKERLPIPPKIKVAVRRRDGGRCRYCSTYAGPMEFDHVLPVAHGGATTVKNLVLACEECNRRKGARIWTPRPLSA